MIQKNSKKINKITIIEKAAKYKAETKKSGVEESKKPKDEIIRNIKKGILLERFSGGRPSADGEFSGVAKNSYYIENGKIKYPISETMISGNIQEMFSNIGEISSDRIDFGYCIFPWISFKGVTVS